MSSGKVSTRLGRRRTTHDTENPLSNREVPCFIGNLPGCNRMHILHIYIWIDIYFYVYIYICSTCTGIYIYLHIYNIYCIYIHTHTHGCLHVLFHVFLNPCKSIQKYWCWLYLFISKCMYVYIYVCVCVYIYMFKFTSSQDNSVWFAIRLLHCCGNAWNNPEIEDVSDSC